MDHVPVLVGEHLDLHVPRVGQVALQVHGRVAEELLAFAGGALERLLQLVLGLGHPESLAAAAARGLDGDRVPDRLLDHRARVLDGGDRLGGSWHDRHARLGHELPGARLRAHRLDRRGGRADERDASLLQRSRERCVLRQEAIARMHRLGAGALDHLEQLVDHEVALAGRPRAEQERLVGALDVWRVAIELGVDRDRADPELLAGADDAHRDLAAVGDQYLREHGAAQDFTFLPPHAANGIR